MVDTKTDTNTDTKELTEVLDITKNSIEKVIQDNLPQLSDIKKQYDWKKILMTLLIWGLPPVVALVLFLLS